MKITPIAAAVAAAALAWAPLAAHDFRIGDLAIGHPYAPETAPTAKTAAGYLTITNDGATPDRLIEVRSALPRTEIHTTEVDTQGVARMSRVDALDILPGETVELAPQGTHVMFMGLSAPLEAGGTLDATLVFEQAGEVAVQFNVEPRDGAADMDHMDHGAPASN
jgi:copper(I)-binding protein